MGTLQKLASLTPWYNKQLIEEYYKKLQSLYNEWIPGKSVLDIGCGPGNLSKEFYNKLGAKIYVGLDYSLGMIQDAYKEYPDKNFICGSTTDLPFNDNSFDIVHSTRLFHHLMPEIRSKTILEQVRVAKRVVILEDLFGCAPGFWRWPHYYYYTLADGSYYRYTLREWKTAFDTLKLPIYDSCYTNEQVIHGRCAYWVLLADK
jgi:ubiquinone/menaquinone biosynthesis C-methylase UbiE